MESLNKQTTTTATIPTSERQRNEKRQKSVKQRLHTKMSNDVKQTLQR